MSVGFVSICLAGTDSATLDLSELRIGSGMATVFEYSPDHKDEPVLSPTVTGGVLTFTSPADGISLVVVPRRQAVPLTCTEA
jgi:hypothetical protein